MQNNCDDINKTLNLAFSPGDVFEVRCLYATAPGARYTHIESGYFTYDNIPKVARELARIDARGVYFTPNPVNPALLARSANRLQAAKRENSTTDADILHRHWFLIDCDPKRPSGISASAEEHDAALYKAIELSERLKSQGWPEPVMLDSGNGAQLMYRIDLPADDDGLIKSCLQALAPFGDDKVSIDQTVFNPARIWRLPGTWNCKGDEVDDRKYRLAKIISMPQSPEIVPVEKLHELAGTVQASVPEKVPNDTAFYIDAWIAEHCPETEDPTDWKDGRKWVFPVCPFNEAHDNRSAVIIQQANGAVGFKCHHNGCIGNDWHALRELKESGCYDSPEETEVDLTAILKIPKKTNMPNKPDPIVPLPEELHNMPGLVNDIMEFSMRGAAHPNRTASFAGAMALMAHLAARKVSLRGIRTNPYFVVLAKSGVGKDYPRKVNNHILGKLGTPETLVATISSTAGLEDALAVNPALLWQSDEFYSFLNEAANDKSGRIEAILAMILMLFSSAGESITTRLLAGKTPSTISCPNLVTLTTSTPTEFFGCLTDRMLGGGLLSRMTVMLSENRSRGQAQTDPGNIPETIIIQAKKWHEFIPPGSGNLNIRVLDATITPE